MVDGDIVIEGDETPAAAPVVVTVVTPTPESTGLSDVETAELIELRKFKADAEAERLAKVEGEAAAAFALANLALEVEPEEQEVVEPEPEEPAKSTAEDVAPDKSHPWFKPL